MFGPLLFAIAVSIYPAVFPGEAPRAAASGGGDAARRDAPESGRRGRAVARAAARPRRPRPSAAAAAACPSTGG